MGFFISSTIADWGPNPDYVPVTDSQKTEYARAGFHNTEEYLDHLRHLAVCDKITTEEYVAACNRWR